MQSIIIIIELQCKHLLQRAHDRILLSNKRRLRLYSLEHAEPSVAGHHWRRGGRVGGTVCAPDLVDEGNSGRGVHSLNRRHSLAAALHSHNDFAAILFCFSSVDCWRNFNKPPHKLQPIIGCDWCNACFKIVRTSTPWFVLPYAGAFYSPFPFFFFMRLIGKCSQLSDLRLFGPAGGGLPVDVGKAGEMLRVFILWVPAWAQRWVHIPRGGIAGRMHRRAGVTAVTWWHIWPPGGNRRGVQPRSAAHQARLHSGHLAVELVLWRGKGGG